MQAVRFPANPSPPETSLTSVRPEKARPPTLSPRIRFTECRLSGCFLLNFPAFRDERGLFVKSLQRSAFKARGLECDFAESFYTESNENVLRGMHFQVPPADHAKLVYCVTGAICDIALDLRLGSPTFGQHETYSLSAEHNNAIYLPRGIAHGFFVESGPSLVVYQVTSEHSPAHDKGIHWDSFGAHWPPFAPLVSSRDEAFPTLLQFKSPFQFTPTPANPRSIVTQGREAPIELLVAER
jgi:dTDP-4-dehydrorhamnose 3,5-epimerase